MLMRICIGKNGSGFGSSSWWTISVSFISPVSFFLVYISVFNEDIIIYYKSNKKLYKKRLSPLFWSHFMLPGSVFFFKMRIRIRPNNADPTGSGFTFHNTAIYIFIWFYLNSSDALFYFVHKTYSIPKKVLKTLYITDLFLLKHLYALDLSFYNIYILDPTPLRNLPNLRTLDLNFYDNHRNSLFRLYNKQF